MINHIKESIRNKVILRLSADLEANRSVDSDDVRQILAEFFVDEQAPLSADDKLQLSKEIIDDVLGYGPLQKLLDDPAVTEIMVNGLNNIYVERNGRIFETDERFSKPEQLKRIIDKIIATTGRRVDESTPMVDTRLPDGSRVNVIIPPLSVDGMIITIRKFAAEPFTTEDLIANGTFTKKAADFFNGCVKGRLNILVSGGTGTGKTTLLNALSSFIPEDERIITIEDAAELQLDQRHIVRLESRPANIEGMGEVTIRGLVRNSLRMRPDRIIVGEVRSGEALDMLQAMNTGHDGSLSTLHANSPRDAVSRLETMVLMSGMDLPMRAVRDQIASAIDLIIHQSRLSDGSRRVVKVSEVIGMDDEILTLQDIFRFDFSNGMDSSGRLSGQLQPTGIRPLFASKLEQRNIDFDYKFFTKQ